MARGLKFWILEEEGLYCLCSGNKGADQLHGYRAAAFVFAYAKIRFSHDVAQIIVQSCLCTSSHLIPQLCIDVNRKLQWCCISLQLLPDSVSHVDGKGRDWKT